MSEVCASDRLLALGRHAGFELTALQVERLQQYLLVLTRWNRRLNLTALQLADLPDASLQRLIGEPLECAALLGHGSAIWFDLGSGGGSPAIPLKIALPGGHLAMVESKSRKVAFLREAVRAVGLQDVEVIPSRVESLADHAQAPTADLITIRALRLDGVVASAVKRLLSGDGRLALFGQAEWPAIESEFDLERRASEVTVWRRRNVPRGT